MAEDDATIDSLGSWLRSRRKALALTQAALAEHVGCATVTIRKLESGVARPSRDMAQRLAVCLEIPPAEHALFLLVALGERRVDRLRPLLKQIESAPRSDTHRPVPVAQLPFDTLPPPSPLPSGSRMPLSRNPLFVGREQDLRQLARSLLVGRTAVIGHVEIAAATGLGGIGKTQLACEFVHRYGQYFAGGVFWLSFADPAAVPAEVAACGGADAMQLCPNFDALPLDQQVKLVIRAWASPTPRLLVFDNCEDEALLERWRPKHGACCVLVTSRRHHWDPALGVQPLPLDVLLRSESLALLRTFRPDLLAEDADLHAIADMLGDLPLALHLAGSFLAKYRHAITPAQYRARLHAPTILDDHSLQTAGLSPTRHVQHVARTFEQSYERLDEAEPADALARTLLTHAACFAPGEPLPRWLLLQTLDLMDAHMEHTLLAEDAVTRLIDLGLLEADDTSGLRLHRLVAAFARAVMVDATAQRVVEVTMLRVADDLNQTGNPLPLLVIQPHLRFITEVAQERTDARTASLCHALGVHLWLLGVYPEAQGCHEQALAIRQHVLGNDHPDTADSLHNLGVMLWEQGQYAEAQRYHERVLALRLRVLGAKHPDTAKSLSNMGLVLYCQGQYAEAQRYHEQALAVRQRVLGADHPETAKSLSNLGVAFYYQGQYAEAQGYHEQALAIYLRVLGADHPYTSGSLNNLGLVLKVQSQYAEAQRYYEQALAVRQRVLGADHPETAKSLNNLGSVLYCQGQYAEAQRYYEQALAIWQRVLGADHPDTVRSLNGLGELLHTQGDYAQARYYHEQALAIRQRVLGDNHPDTIESLYNLGVVLKDQGQYAEAQRYLEDALALRQRVLGDNHPDTARSLRGLGGLLHAQGMGAQARCYMQQALTIFVQQLGPDHPDTEQTHQTLATLGTEHTLADLES